MLKLLALEHIRQMGGSSRPHLMRCSDGKYYVVKFQGNPTGTRSLASDLLGTILARRLGLPTAAFAVVDVSKPLIDLASEMGLDLDRRTYTCRPGLSLGSSYISCPPRAGETQTEFSQSYLPGTRLLSTSNLTDFIGILVFDIWTSNQDSRQFVFARNAEPGTWKATMIDQDRCFGGASWSFRDQLSIYIYSSLAYQSVTGIKSFDPWLSRLEVEISAKDLEEAASEVPQEWYDSDGAALRRLLRILDHRRRMVRELVWRAHENSRSVFPNWLDHQSSPRRSRLENAGIRDTASGVSTQLLPRKPRVTAVRVLGLSS